MANRIWIGDVRIHSELTHWRARGGKFCAFGTRRSTTRWKPWRRQSIERACGELKSAEVHTTFLRLPSLVACIAGMARELGHAEVADLPFPPHPNPSPPAINILRRTP